MFVYGASFKCNFSFILVCFYALQTYSYSCMYFCLHVRRLIRRIACYYVIENSKWIFLFQLGFQAVCVTFKISQLLVPQIL